MSEQVLMKGNEAIAEADLLIAAGIRFSDRVALNTGKFAPNAKILQFDIDPSENSKNINVTSFLYGDLKDCLNMISRYELERR